MNILVVGRVFPWLTHGALAHTKVARPPNIVQALSELGEVDYFAVLSPWQTREVEGAPQPFEAPVARFGWGTRTDRPHNRLSASRWMVGSQLPYELAQRDYDGVRSRFRAWMRPDYDLVWFVPAEGYVALQGLVEAPCIVDFDDLEDFKIASKLGLGTYGERSLAAAGWGRAGAVVARRAAQIHGRANVRRWRRLEKNIASSVSSAVVCSDLDRARLGDSNCAVIPNGYAPPERAVGHLDVGQPPTLTLIGNLTYTPNADSARYFLGDILPRIIARVPSVRVRIVGHHDERMEELRSANVTFTGAVPDIEDELAKADVAIVPIRFGSGTRVKILEAFAHRLPVVSTVVGCEGIDAEDRRHLLVADDPDGFASACVELISNPALRASLTAEAHDLYWRRYRWDVIRPQVIELARGVIGVSTSQVGTASTSLAREGR